MKVLIWSGVRGQSIDDQVCAGVGELDLQFPVVMVGTGGEKWELGMFT